MQFAAIKSISSLPYVGHAFSRLPIYFTHCDSDIKFISEIYFLKLLRNLLIQLRPLFLLAALAEK